MAWKTEVPSTFGEGSVGGKQYTVMSETLTPVGDTLSSHWTSVIDFIPPGCDFQVVANSAGNNMSASGHIELFVSYDRAATAASGRERMKQTPFLPVTADVDNSTKVLMRDVSTYGQFPYYWLKFCSADTTGGGTGNATMTFKVIVGAQDAKVDVT